MVRDADGIHFTDYGYDMIAGSPPREANQISDKVDSETSEAK